MHVAGLFLKSSDKYFMTLQDLAGMAHYQREETEYIFKS